MFPAAPRLACAKRGAGRGLGWAGLARGKEDGRRTFGREGREMGKGARGVGRREERAGRASARARRRQGRRERARRARSRAGAGGGLGAGAGAGRREALSARRRAECSGPRPGHVRTRGRGPRPPRPGPQHRPPRPGSPRGRGYGAGGRGRGPGRQESGPRWGGGWGASHSQLARLAPGPWCHPGAAQRGGRAGRRGKFLRARARTPEEARPESAWGRSSGSIWSRDGDGLGVGRVEVLQGGRKWRGRADGCALEPTGAGEAGARSERGSSLDPEVSWKEEAPLSPRPRFCDTLRLGSGAVSA